MGAYLSSPVTDKISCDQTCEGYTYGASSMQGWRISQEDAHNCLPDFDEETGTSLFAVYDGHGGAEVAQYCAMHLPKYIKETESYMANNLGQGLIDAFLEFDSILIKENVIKELKELAGEDEDEDEEDDDDPVGRGEADALRAEADLPLDQILAKYQTSSVGATKSLRKKDVFQSPQVRAKQGQEERAKRTAGDDEACAGSSCSSSALGEGSSSLDFSDSLINGHAENENNLNKEKELQNTFQAAADNFVENSVDCVSSSDSKISSDADGVIDNSSDTKNFAETAELSNGGTNSKSLEASGDSVSSSGTSSVETSSAVVSSSALDAASGSSSMAAEESITKSSCGSLGESSGSSVKFEEDEEPGPSGSGQSGHEPCRSGNKISLKEEDIDMDDESDDDEEDEWQEDSDDEEDDDEEEEDEEEEVGEGDEPIMDMSNEEPGSDSGCTACVALMRKSQIVVANAGDSRCVISRKGKAAELSFDHKPEDECERLRIEKAGGKVTADGRVNGGLNLSRAIGDHFYKRKEGLPPQEQMITAFPDIQTLTLEPDDEFMVLACDGIWNYMSSQDVVDFVAERLKDPVKRKKLSLICEEMFDHCLAPNTCGDGTGCDNMTCIIVTFNNSESVGDCLPPSKRCVGDLENVVENVEKRPRVDECEENQGDSLKICEDDNTE